MITNPVRPLAFSCLQDFGNFQARSCWEGAWMAVLAKQLGEHKGMRALGWLQLAGLDALQLPPALPLTGPALHLAQCRMLRGRSGSSGSGCGRCRTGGGAGGTCHWPLRRNTLAPTLLAIDRWVPVCARRQ